MAAEDDPIRKICNLPDEELKVRRARVSRELFAFVRKREERPSGLVLHFDESSEMRERLDSFVAAERICCSSIGWSVGEGAGLLRLEISGIDPKSVAFASVGASVGSTSVEAAER